MKDRRCRATVVSLLLLTIVLLPGAHAADSDGFPFVIPETGVESGTAPALLAPDGADPGSGGFVVVDGENFVLSNSGQEVRFWGTNLCFAGCFPPHAVAERMAQRLASLGVNCVRFHHMDRAAYPRGIWKGPREGAWSGFAHEKFHPEALDRLDYLVAQLKKHGIYTNFNLHVSRGYGEADGFPAVGPGESVPNYGKGVDNYHPRCIREQERYARMLLRHRNEYTGNVYAREPAVAMVEISNEDSLVREWSRGALDRLPEPYVRELEKQWNEWLEEKYDDTAELRQAWARGGAGRERPEPARRRRGSHHAGNPRRRQRLDNPHERQRPRAAHGHRGGARPRELARAAQMGSLCGGKGPRL